MSSNTTNPPPEARLLAEVLADYASEGAPFWRDADTSHAPSSVMLTADEGLAKLKKELVNGQALSWGRQGAPTGPWLKIDPDAWLSLNFLDVPQGLVGVARELPQTLYWYLHILTLRKPTPLIGKWDYLDNAALRLSHTFSSPLDLAEDAVADAIWLDVVTLSTGKNGNFSPYTEPPCRYADIAIRYNRIIPMFDGRGFTEASESLPVIYVNYPELEAWFEPRQDEYRPYWIPRIDRQCSVATPREQQAKRKQVDLFVECYESLPEEIRNLVHSSRRGDLKKLENEMRSRCPKLSKGVQDLSRVRRQYMHNEKINRK